MLAKTTSRKATRRALERMPRTPDGDRRFAEMMGCIISTDKNFERFLQAEALARPNIYESIMRYLILNDAKPPSRSNKTSE